MDSISWRSVRSRLFVISDAGPGPNEIAKRANVQTTFAERVISTKLPCMNIAEVVGQLKDERDRLDRAIAALSGLNGTAKSRFKTKRFLSPDARERIAKAQRLRWKKQKAAQK